MSKFKHKTQVGRITPRKSAKRAPLRTAAELAISNRATVVKRSYSGSRTLTQTVDRANRFREHLNPLRGLTIAYAVRIAEEYFLGRMADLQWTYFFIEQTDADLLALLELRIGRLLEMDYNITIAKDADERQAEAQRKYLSEKFERIDNIYESIEHLALADFRGFAHCEKWIEGGELTHLECVDQWNAVRDGARGPWRYNPDARSCSYESLGSEMDMPPENFLFREVRRPINRVALFKFVRGNLSEKDWDASIEVFGNRGGVVIGPPDVAEADEAEFESAAENIADGGRGYLPYGSLWVPNKEESGSWPFSERLKHLSEKLVLAGTGGKLTMLTDPTGLGSGASDAHSRVFDTVASAAARRISEVFNKQLVLPWLQEKFPGQKPAAYFTLAANEETDVGEIVDHAVSLSQAGYQMDPAQLEEKLGYTLTVKPAAPAFGPPNGAAFLNRIRNRSSAAATKLFNSDALKELTAAQAISFRPLIDRALAVAGTDDAGFDAALQKLQADLPEIQKQVLAKDATGEFAKIWEKILGTALVNGAATAAAERQGKLTA